MTGSSAGYSTELPFLILSEDLQCHVSVSYTHLTVIGVVLIGLCMSIPSLLNLGTSSDTDTAEPPTAVEASDIDGAILVIDQTGYYTDTSLFTNGLSAQYTYQIEADPDDGNDDKGLIFKVLA